MKVIQGLRPDIVPACAMTLGMFDGVHRGHQALLHGCRRHADALGLPAVALTYEPHPSVVLRPEQPVSLLTPLSEKLERLADYAMDYVVVADFTPTFSQLSAESFLRDILVADLHPQVVVAGYRTTFGHDRAGTADVLRAMGQMLGFAVEIIPPIEVAGNPVSSSRIRQLLTEGQVELAAELLGYRYRLSGVVAQGDGRGHQLGFPTANLEVPVSKLVPADGVYVVEAAAPGVAHRGVMNIGCRPTFQRPHCLEVHLLDFHADLYAQPLSVTFLTRLRDVQTFDTTDALLAQIRTDIELAQAYGG